jgi:YlmC/YmxH family sporulation protein
MALIYFLGNELVHFLLLNAANCPYILGTVRGGALMPRISDFQAKEVVNVENGKRLGHIGDLDVNLSSGKIDNLIIPGTGKIMGLFGKENDIVVPWNNIVRIGADVILVRFYTEHNSTIKSEE